MSTAACTGACPDQPMATCISMSMRPRFLLAVHRASYCKGPALVVILCAREHPQHVGKTQARVTHVHGLTGLAPVSITSAEGQRLFWVVGVTLICRRLASTLTPSDSDLQVQLETACRHVTWTCITRGHTPGCGHMSEASFNLRGTRSLATALYAARDGTGEVREILVNSTFNPRLPGALLTCSIDAAVTLLEQLERPRHDRGTPCQVITAGVRFPACLMPRSLSRVFSNATALSSLQPACRDTPLDCQRTRSCGKHRGL